MGRVTIYFLFILVLTVQVYTKPSSDQYKQQADPANGSEQKTSLHKVQLTSTGLHPVNLLPQQTNLEEPKVAELQVGCADGSVKNGDQTKKEKRAVRRRLSKELIGKDVEDIERIRNKRDTEAEDMTKHLKEHEIVEQIEPEVKTRSKRNYWFGNTGFYTPSFTPYQFPSSPFPSSQFPSVPSYTQSYYNLPSTQSYQVVIPLFGGHIPILFPPRPVIYNPGYPPHNRPRPERPTQPQNETGLTVDDRWGYDTDDRPSWGVVDDSEEEGGGSNTVTTRRPSVSRPVTKPPTPPLFHRPSLGEDGEGNVPDVPANDLLSRPTEGPRPQTPSTRRPTINQRPIQTQRPPIQTRPPVRTTTTEAPEAQLPRCTWAIITCCNPANENIRYRCFENAGCLGNFWDGNPCSKEYTLAALDAAQKFYESQ